MALPNWLTPLLMLLFYTHLEVQFSDQKGKMDQKITLALRQIIAPQSLKNVFIT